MKGWIKLYKKLLNWEWFGDSNVVHIFIYLLLSANYDKNQWRGVEVGRGQLIVSLNGISAVTGLSHQQIRTALAKLERSGEINKESNKLYTLITVLNYEDYQDEPIESNKESNIETTKPVEANIAEEFYPVEEFIPEQTPEPQSEVSLFPVEEVKEKKDKTMLFKNSIYADKELLASKMCPKEFKGIDFTYYYNAVYDWSELKSQKRSNNGWAATIRTWIRRDIAEGKAKMLKATGYGVTDTELTDFMKY